MPAHEHTSSQFDEYRGRHQPGMGAPIHDLTSEMPEDVYTHPHYYGHGDKVNDREASSVIKAVGRSRDPEMPIRVYRAVPHGVTSINQGDWVTTSPSYARQHGYHADDPSQDWPVLSATVPARHVASGGNDILEWGYTGPSIDQAEVHHPGGSG